MGMATTARKWTIEEWRALPEDGRRYELIDGILLVNGVIVPDGDLEALPREMTPSPSWSHQDAVARLLLLLLPYARERMLGDVIVSPADVELEPGRVVEPDLFVVPLVGGKRPRAWEEVGRLLLAVEVLSPSTARVDRTLKRHFYQRAGVPEYWIVDVDARLIERWRPEDERPEILTERIEWGPDAAQPPLVVELEPFFAEVAGD